MGYANLLIREGGPRLANYDSRINLANYDFIQAESPLIFLFNLFAKRKMKLGCYVWLVDGKVSRSSSNRTRERRKQTRAARALHPNSRNSIASVRVFSFLASDWSVNWRVQLTPRTAACWSSPSPKSIANSPLLNKLRLA
jgi:hypothetical protein